MKCIYWLGLIIPFPEIGSEETRHNDMFTKYLLWYFLYSNDKNGNNLKHVFEEYLIAGQNDSVWK